MSTASATKSTDLTQGGIAGKLLMVAAPIMGTQLLQMAYNVTDMFWLGRVSSDVVAAAGTAGMYLWLSAGVMFIGRMGAEIGVAQHLGRGEPDLARSYSQNALLLSAVLGVIFGLLMAIFHGPLIGFFSIREPQVARAAEQYLALTAIGIPASMISATVAGIFTASGNSRIPFYVNLVGLGGNMLLDPILILNCGLGIVGAALATGIAQTVVAVLSLIAIKWHRTRPLGEYPLRIRPDRKKIRQIFLWSAPIALENMLFCFFSMFITKFVAGFGAQATAVQKIGVQIESLAWLIAGGFSSAVTAFVGQNYGAGRWSRIRRGVGVSAGFMLLWGVMVMALLYLLGGPLIGLFLPDKELIRMGANYLSILALCQIPNTLEGVGIGVFRGIGKTLPPSVVGIVSNGLRAPLCYALSLTALGLDGIWWGISVGACIRGLWLIFWCVWMLRRQPRDDLSTDTPLPKGIS